MALGKRQFSVKTFKELYESIKWEQKWSMSLDSKGQKVYDWFTADGKWKLTLTGYDGIVGKSFPSGSKKTSWMVVDLETDKPVRTTYSTLPKAKKAVEAMY